MRRVLQESGGAGLVLVQVFGYSNTQGSGPKKAKETVFLPETNHKAHCTRVDYRSGRQDGDFKFIRKDCGTSFSVVILTLWYVH